MSLNVRYLAVGIGLFCGGIGLILGVGYHWYDALFQQPIRVQSKQEVLRVVIPKGASLDEVGRLLAKQQILKDWTHWRLLKNWRSDMHQVQAGEFELQSEWSLNQVMDHLIQGTPILHKITFPEGLRLHNIAKRLESKKLGSHQRYLKLSHDAHFIKSLDLPFPVKSLEGLLFPETYFFSRTNTEEQILKTMVQQFFQNYTPQQQARARELGLSDYEVLILASIIEKETGAASERALISGVFHNRLKRNMRLETDPTVIYGVPNFDGNLTKAHLRTPSPYNTYLNKGLPPTPISNPGKASIQSALYPKKVDYLFFVAKGDGTSYFSSTLKEHNRAVRRFQKRPKRRN